MMGCKAESLTIKYLGIPVRVGRLIKRDYYILLHKLERCLDGWVARPLSFGGCLIVVNIVLLVANVLHVLFYFAQMGWGEHR